MVDVVSDILANKYNYLGFIVLMMIGLWAMLAKNNFAKKILGMAIFQSAIILFYISVSVKENATLPILQNYGHGKAEKGAEAAGYPASGMANAAGDAAHGAAHAANATGDVLHTATQAAGEAATYGAQHVINAADYVNPLPHVLMLTAIVVSVATLGVALALAMKVYKEYNTLDEDTVLEKIRQ
jgi:multicomponent Na+:H+ antiporter subunit C